MKCRLSFKNLHQNSPLSSTTWSKARERLTNPQTIFRPSLLKRDHIGKSLWHKSSIAKNRSPQSLVIKYRSPRHYDLHGTIVGKQARERSSACTKGDFWTHRLTPEHTWPSQHPRSCERHPLRGPLPFPSPKKYSFFENSSPIKASLANESSAKIGFKIVYNYE